ncbi:MAG: hypothetical protein QXS68_06085 [Candidatus Methanomethylicaceae archaeon]
MIELGRNLKKRKTRIPGVMLGDVVNASEGPKKKVCFNIGGRWFWRMVDRSWKAPGRPPSDKAKKMSQRVWQFSLI